MKILAIVNPAARGGRLGRRWPELQSKLRAAAGSFDVAFTQAPRDATAAAARAVAKGCDLIIAAGGDGTLNEVVNGMASAENGTHQATALAIAGFGSSNDFIRTMGQKPGLEGVLAALQSGRRRKIDLGLIRFHNGTDQETRHWFLNAANVGLAGEIAIAMAQSKIKKMLGSGFAYPPVVLGVLRRYTGRKVSVLTDDGQQRELDIKALSVCNGRYFGAGMQVAPQASASDGMFDVVVFAQAPRIGALDVPLIYSGRHLSHPAVSWFKAKRLEIGFAEGEAPALCEADGELLGCLPCTINIMPQALTVLS